MIDLNHQPKFHEKVTALVDAALQAESSHTRKASVSRRLPPRRELRACPAVRVCRCAGRSRGRVSGRTLRIFDVGHALEDLAIRWLRLAGIDLHTRRKDGGQFGFSVANGRIQGHVDGVIADAPADLGLTFPTLWECKTMNDRNWKACVKSGVAVSKPVYAAQVAIYQAYMEPAIPGISDHPALFTAINKDTQELWFELVPFDGGLAQRMSDRAVRVIQATEAGELLPRIATDSSYYECKYCSWATRCWSAA
jgi:hypothetical protein